MSTASNTIKCNWNSLLVSVEFHSELNPAVQAYLDEHLVRGIGQQRLPVNVKQSSLKPRQLRRRMSCKGAIKKTRSINVDSECCFASSSLAAKLSFSIWD